MEMKAEINYQNKEKFFAQHWGQECFYSGRPEQKQPYKLSETYSPMLKKYADRCFLSLKPLSSISDEDASFVCSHHRIISSDNKWSVNSGIILDGFTTDFLRSRGYALPWMGLSVDEMVEAGWIKLVE